MKRKNFDDIINRNAVVSRWSRFIDEKTSTDLWTENDFLFFLDNEEIILNFTWDFYDGKYKIIKDENHRRKEIYKQKLDRLREIYNERFKVQLNEIDYADTLETATQKVLLMHELGIFELLKQIPEIKDNQTKLCELMSAFTGLNTDTIRKPYAALYDDKDTSGYNIRNKKNNTALDKLYNDLGIKRKIK